MMQMSYGEQGQLPVSYPYDGFMDDFNVQVAARRLSRGSSCQRTGMTSRVSKHPSASNSPRSSMMLNRRRTMMNEVQLPGQQPAMDYVSMGLGQESHNQPSARTARPVSWHPSTHLQPRLYSYQQTQYPLSTPSMHTENQDMFSQPHFSPMMASYSNNTSPCSTFSPLPLPTSHGADVSHYFSADRPDMDQRSLSLFAGVPDNQGFVEAFPAFDNTMNDNGSSQTLDWNAFVMHGFNNTSPPTPESFLPVQQAQPVLSDQSTARATMDDQEDDGEILVGMGLYDQPEKYEEDPHLNNYRSTVSSLLGSGFRPREPQGKGLKLEETWEPPKSEDEEEDDEDSGDSSEDEN
ncbi:hypothetical protein S7711_03781 [Stachybotrys chartarum IBT 7711]|uniref:Uncharacterized protein n=1 Tax=Stachybotrys chartarum (strain CBS 109288 / IBT 7711) TaxID=1280523 RepID=A0A084AWX6_STACB|nr:hypothetical protein S7711_03781 [Stachybotrys chartarum IBT 7711]KFA46339.1 hypothetical protein S40293_08642 [Stachybotrys chartarum IBT 40293]